MKEYFQRSLQRLLGYETYLFIFSVYSIMRAFTGRYEKEFSFFLKSLNTNSEGCIVDVGANIGITAIPFAKKFAKAIVYAFEPVPANMRTLKKVSSVFSCKNIQYQPVALSNTEGKAQMIVPITNGIKRQGLSRFKSTDHHDLNLPGEELLVPVTTLNSWWNKTNKPKIKAIKIDVENLEYQVLLGAKEVLLHARPMVYCELWDDNKRLLCIKYMVSLGYEAKVYVNGTVEPYTNQKVMNFYFFPAA